MDVGLLLTALFDEKASTMTTEPRVYVPRSATDYGEHRWHLKWTVDFAGRRMVHQSGLSYRLKIHDGTHPPFPFQGRLIGAWWHGQIDTAPARPLKQHAEIRLWLEALQLWQDMTKFICLDCYIDTMEDHYYMVHNIVWLQAHPKEHGMLCLDCLSARLGRALRAKDFIQCPINDWNPKVRAIREQ